MGKILLYKCNRYVYAVMNKVILSSLIALFPLCMNSQPIDGVFNGCQWIGAITRAKANIPAGRTFTSDVMKRADAKAAWAAVDTLSNKSILLKKDIIISHKIKSAKAYVCGLGFYEFSINGRKVGDAMFAPLWSDYDKSVFYNTYDVTSMLAEGEQKLEVLLGNGFYNEQGGRYYKLRISFGPPTLLFRLHIIYADGRETNFCSDKDWSYSLSPITFNSIYGGEDYDARWKPVWHSVVIQEAPKGKLRAQIASPVKLMETFGVKCCKQLSLAEVEAACKSTKRNVDKSAMVLDMGQNLSGFPQITVSGKSGQKITMLVSETLTAEGACNQRQTGRPYYYVYTLKGGDSETWHPRFSYYGFRYIQVEGAVLKGQPNPDGLPEISDIHSCFIYNSARKIGTFECSNPLFNKTSQIIDRAIRSNWQSVWTDCPHREKLGWLEQDWLNGEGLVYNYDARTMIEQTMQNIADAQHPNGAVPTTAPEYVVFQGEWAEPFVESPEWGGAFIALPFLYMTHYGNNSLIRKYYAPMKRYVDYLATKDSAFILKQGLGDWYDYGPWKAGFAKNTSVPLVATAHYYKWTKMMADAAKIVGNKADEEILSQRADKIKEAFNRCFYNPNTHQYGTGSQTANAIAIDMKLVADKDKAAVMANLIADIHAHNDRLTTGDVGNRYLFNVLDANGERNLLYKMLNHYDVPGYGFQIKKGMTTLTEQWNPEMGASMNHFMMGHINNLLIPSLVGINVYGKKIVIAPHPVGDLNWCKGSTECAGGIIKCEWKITDGSFIMDTEIPDGVVATAITPSGKQHKLKKGKQQIKEVIQRN